MPRSPKLSIDDVLGPTGLLSRNLASFQYRAEQLEVAQAIDEAFRCGRHALVEAGTGVGKTLAYLVPAVRAIHNGKKVIVSTHTINLQSQLFEKDIPLVRSLFPAIDIKPALLKGRNNYLCLQDLSNAEGDLFHMTNSAFAGVKRWARKTETGDVAELDFTYQGWYEIAANQDTCRQKECDKYGSCFYYRARKAVNEANLIVVNHALLLSSALVQTDEPQTSILPECDLLIIDEAHHLESAATNVFGIEFNNRRLIQLAERLRRLKSVEGLHARLTAIELLNERLFSNIESSRAEFFLTDVLSESGLAEHAAIVKELCTNLEGIQQSLLKSADGEEGAAKERLQGLGRTVSRTKEELYTLSNGTDPNYIRWAESTSANVRRGGKAVTRTTLHLTPIAVGEQLNGVLWQKVPSAILTSATLANSHGFGYVRGRLGLQDDPIEKIVGSPFDFKKQSMLYVPSHLPEPPKAANSEYTVLVADEIDRIVKLTEGRAFLLFTSRRMLNDVFDILQVRLDMPLFKQGEMPPARLLQEFRESGNGCLFGVQTFWEGVDVQGEALSCVIIDRLPFAVPDSPINRARTEAITARGGDSFREFSIPQAQIRLKQGFGRLIRTKDDRGIICILDSRMLTKRYGAEFVRNLPPASRASLWKGVERFWSREIETAVVAPIT